MSGKNQSAFDYSAVGKKNRAWLARVTEKVRQLHARTSVGAVEMGRYILQAKERLPHGQFLKWAEAELPFGRRTAYNLIAVATKFGQLKVATVANFEVMALYDLAETTVPTEARAEAVKLAERGQSITRERAKELVEAAPKPDREPRRGYFQSDPDGAAAAALVRGVLVDRLDKAFTEGRLGELLGRDHPDEEVRDRANHLYDAIYSALFPEEVKDSPGERGLVPDSVKRVSPANYRAFAETLRAGKAG